MRPSSSTRRRRCSGLMARAQRGARGPTVPRQVIRGKSKTSSPARAKPTGNQWKAGSFGSPSPSPETRLVSRVLSAKPTGRTGASGAHVFTDAGLEPADPTPAWISVRSSSHCCCPLPGCKCRPQGRPRACHCPPPRHHERRRPRKSSADSRPDEYQPRAGWPLKVPGKSREAESARVPAAPQTTSSKSSAREGIQSSGTRTIMTSVEVLVGPERFELSTNGLKVHCSTS